MTYRELLLSIGKMNEDQLDSHVTVRDDNGEFHSASISFATDEDEDVLYYGHPYLDRLGG
jgi:hypothetical protein